MVDDQPAEELLAIARKFFDSMTGEEWASIRAMVTDDVVWTMPGTSRISGAVQGKEAVVERVRRVAAAGVRWGLDAAHRAPFKLDGLDAGTWRFGLDRLLLGVTMTEEDRRRFGGVLPLDDVESGAIDLAGRLAELIDRLTTALDSFARPQPIAAWCSTSVPARLR